MNHSASGATLGIGFVRRRSAGAVALMFTALLIAAGCTSDGKGLSMATVAGATATPAATGTPTATDTPTVAPTATATPTAAPTATPAVTAPPAPAATPLPPLAIGLCTAAQLKLEITAWIDGSGTTYAHVTATNVSSASCSMRGTPRTQVIDGHGSVITDSGAAGSEISTGDPVYTLAPNGQINDIFTWGNWCKSAPTQNIRVAAVMPFGLGKVLAPAVGVAPVPTCYASGSGSTVSAEAWLP